MGRTNREFSSLFPRTLAPTHLCEQVCSAIARERMRRERIRLFVSSLCGTSSLAGLVFALPALVQAASTTGFLAYVQLLISDSDLASSNLNSFVTPILESLPGVEMILTLFLFAVLLTSLRAMAVSLIRNPLYMRPA